MPVLLKLRLQLHRILSVFAFMLVTTLSVSPVFGSPALLHLPLGKFTPPTEFFVFADRGIRNPKAITTSRQAEILYPYALASHMAHSYKLARSKAKDHHWNFDRLNFLELTPIDERMIPSSCKHLFKTKTQRFEHHRSGLQARGFLHKPTRTLILAFAGTDFDLGHRSRTTLFSSTKIVWSYQARMLDEAHKLCRELRESERYAHIILTGSSLGGAVAQYAGLACDLPAIAFNSLALSKELRSTALRARHSDANTSTAASGLILAQIEGEVLNGTSWSSHLLQNPHPAGVPIFMIAPANPHLSMLKRHSTSAVVAGLEKLAGYHFPLWDAADK